MPDYGIEIVDNFLPPAKNPHEDRITAILQKRAQPAPQMVSPQEFDAYGIGNIAAGSGAQALLDTINSLQRTRKQDYNAEQDRELQGAQTLYDIFEQKRSMGDKQAQALFDKISLFTGGDPEGTALFVEQLHNDPESIDPGNAFQVMSKLAGIAKRTGYSSPESQLNKLKIKQAQKDLNKSDQPDLPAAYEEYLLSQQDPGFGDYLKQKKEKPMPPAAVKLQNESLDIIGTANSLNARLDGTIKKLEGNKLSIGPIRNVVSSGLNKAGASTENSRNYASFIGDLEKFRNDSLRLNKGVQTEGDAQRAWNEIVANPNDEKLVAQRLREIQGYNKRAAELQKLNVDQIRANYGNEPLDFTEYENPTGETQLEDPLGIR
jgi:hypothetical protein